MLDVVVMSAMLCKESKKIVKGKDVVKDGEDDEGIMYFDFVLPRIKKAHPELKYGRELGRSAIRLPFCCCGT